MFPQKRITLILLAMILCNIIFATQAVSTKGQLFVDTMIMVNPIDISVSYDTEFAITVTNMLTDQSIWVFCLCDANITRVDAPVFLTIESNDSYVFRFISPPRPPEDYEYYDLNNTALTSFTPSYSVYFGAVDYAATSFQTAQVLLSMTSVASLTYQISQLYVQNQQLMKEVLKLQDRAGMNNLLVIVAVATNVFWVTVIFAMKLRQRPKSDEEIPKPPTS